jgi:hypothetical protein
MDDWIFWHIIHIYTTRDYRQYSAIAIPYTLQFTVAHALGFSFFTSRILATYLSQSHSHFKSLVKSSCHNLVPSLPLFCSCQFRTLDSIRFLCSQVHNPAGLRPESRLLTPWLLFSTRSVKVKVKFKVKVILRSWNKSPIWGLRPDLYYCQIFAGLLIWGALSDERTGLSFTTAAGPRQRRHSCVRVSWDLWPYFFCVLL